VRGVTIKKEDMLRHLNKIVDNGDPVFILEFYSGEMDICTLPFKASLMLKSIESGASCLYNGEMPQIKPKSPLLTYTRWWLFPIIFALWCWLLLLNPQLLSHYWVTPNKDTFSVFSRRANTPPEINRSEQIRLNLLEEESKYQEKLDEKLEDNSME